MTNYKPYISALRQCAKEHENDITPFAHIIVSDLCKDTANLLEELEQESKAKTFDILHFVADNAGLSTFEAIEKAYNIGVSEQEAVLDKIRAEIREWYWQADKQELAKDPCVVDAMIDLFIRTIAKYQSESEETDG